MKKLRYLILTKSLGLYINALSYVRPQKASMLAYKLFSHPRDGRLTPESLPEILKSATSESLLHEDGHFHSYVWPGNHETILLIHGWESNSSRWEKLLPYLQATGKTIVAIDGPAHGLSSGLEFNVPAYAGFIDAAVRKFNPQYLIGHSIGGAACVYYQYKYKSDSLKKMVLLGAPSDLEVLISNYVSLLSLNSRMVKLLEAHFWEKFKFRLADFSGRVFGTALKVNGIIAHDVADTVVAFSEAKKIAGSWKNAQFIQTSGLGHAMHDDELYKRIANFINEKSGQ